MDSDPAPRPITERVLRRLGRPKWLWILLWAVVPLGSQLAFMTGIRLSGQPLSTAVIVNLLATQGVLSYAVVILLLGVGLLTLEAADVRDHVSKLVPGDRPIGLFRGIGSVRGPLAVTALVAAIISAVGG
jgi:hypothetical protein